MEFGITNNQYRCLLITPWRKEEYHWQVLANLAGLVKKAHKAPTIVANLAQFFLQARYAWVSKTCINDWVQQTMCLQISFEQRVWFRSFAEIGPTPLFTFGQSTNTTRTFWCRGAIDCLQGIWECLLFLVQIESNHFARVCLLSLSSQARAVDGHALLCSIHILICCM